MKQEEHCNVPDVKASHPISVREDATMSTILNAVPQVRFSTSGGGGGGGGRGGGGGQDSYIAYIALGSSCQCVFHIHNTSGTKSAR